MSPAQVESPDNTAEQEPSRGDLLQYFKAAVERLITDDITGESEPERIWILRQARKSDLYWRNLQNIAPYSFESGIIDFSSQGTPIAGGDTREGTGLYDYTQNIYRGYGRKFAAVIGQRSPNVKAVADNSSDEQSMEMARLADNVAEIFRARWDVELKNIELVTQLWKSGTVWAYTPYVKNKRKYGESSEPKIEMRDVALGPPTYHCQHCGADTPEDQINPLTPACPQCGSPLGPEAYRPPETMPAPIAVGEVVFENGSVELEFLNCMFVATPFFAKDIDDCAWLVYDCDVHKGKLLALYPQLRKEGDLDNMGTDSVGSSSGQLARDSAASPLGTPVPHRASRWNYKRVWARPEMYECIKDEDIRENCHKYFPDGMKIVMVAGKVCDIEAENLSDVWAMCKPETSDFIWADGIGFDLLSLQDLINDCAVNIPAETIERGLSITFADPRIYNFEQWNQHQAKSAEVVPALAPVDGSLSEGFYTVPPVQFSEQILPWMSNMQQVGMQNVGVVPEIFGGGDADTARQAEINKNAALMQLGTTWLMVRKCWEKIYLNATRQMARWGSGTLRHGGISVDLTELADEGYHFEADEAMPMTWAQQRDFIMWLLEKPPQLLQAYGVTHPMNVEKNQSLLGMTDWYTPGLDEFEKIMETIQKLSEASPIQQPQPDGSMQLAPSIKPDEFEDQHDAVVATVQAWCNSLAGRRLREQKPDGYINVVLFGKAHAQLAAPPPPPPQPPKVTLSGKIPLDQQQGVAILQQEGINVPAPTGPITNAHGQVAPPMPPTPSRPAPASSLGGISWQNPPLVPTGPMLKPGGPPAPGGNVLTGLQAS